MILNIPETTKKIKRKTFKNIDIIDILTIPNSVKYYEKKAFEKTVVKKIDLPYRTSFLQAFCWTNVDHAEPILLKELYLRDPENKEIIIHAKNLKYWMLYDINYILQTRDYERKTLFSIKCPLVLYGKNERAKEYIKENLYSFIDYCVKENRIEDFKIIIQDNLTKENRTEIIDHLIELNDKYQKGYEHYIWLNEYIHENYPPTYFSL